MSEVEEELVKITSGGTISIPKQFRRYLEMQKGDYVKIGLEGDHLVVRKVRITQFLISKMRFQIVKTQFLSSKIKFLNIGISRQKPSVFYWVLCLANTKKGMFLSFKINNCNFDEIQARNMSENVFSSVILKYMDGCFLDVLGTPIRV